MVDRFLTQLWCKHDHRLECELPHEGNGIGKARGEGWVDLVFNDGGGEGATKGVDVLEEGFADGAVVGGKELGDGGDHLWVF